MIKKLLFFILLFNITSLNAQSIYQHTSSSTIYEFLEELTDQQHLNISTVVQPYTRQFIARQLQSLDPTLLNKRQQLELAFFLKEYNKELKRKEFSQAFQSDNFLSKNILFNESKEKRKDALFYEDGNVQMTINPVLGVEYNLSADNFQRWYGAKLDAYFGDDFAAWVSFRDVSESERLTSPTFLNQRQGGVARDNTFRGVSDYSETRAGVTYAWKWGTIGLVQDQFVWGNHNNGALIFAGRQPSIPQIRLDVNPTKWLEFHYVHAFLSSEVIDSTRTYPVSTGVDRVVFTPKYMAANFFVLKPFKNFYFSFGNSMVYADTPLQAAYLIPFLFYKSTDHLWSAQNNRAGQNGQLFFDVSSRNIKNLHIYSSLFVDEVRLSTITDPEQQRNQVSFKFGGRLSNILNSNISVIAEYTRSNPYAYRHFIESTDFTSSQFNLGHYLGDNAQEMYLGLTYKPIPKLWAKIYYLNAQKGETLPFGNGAIGGQTAAPFLENIVYERTEIGLDLQYEWWHDVYFKLHIRNTDIQDETGIYTPEFMLGKQTMATLGVLWNY